MFTTNNTIYFHFILATSPKMVNISGFSQHFLSHNAHFNIIHHSSYDNENVSVFFPLHASTSGVHTIFYFAQTVC